MIKNTTEKLVQQYQQLLKEVKENQDALLNYFYEETEKDPSNEIYILGDLLEVVGARS